MGFALAYEAYLNGGDVTLVSGPTELKLKYEGIQLIKVKTAAEMFEACKEHSSNSDIMIMNAAVADYSPVKIYGEKLKKKDENLSIELAKTIDILKYLGEHKQDNQFVMGFALETNDEENNAVEKLRKKKLDCIVLNSLQTKGAGFSNDTNEVTIINKDETKIYFILQSKTDIARHIISYLITNVS